MTQAFENQENGRTNLPIISVGLDIGTSKICALVTSIDQERINEDQTSLKILGIGIAESEGLNRGVVVNIERTVGTIKKVIEQAQQQSGIEIKEVIVGIAGDHIESFQTRGIVGISNPTNEISASDVQRLLDDTRKVAIPSERQIIHVMPQDFIIDGQDGITDPIGISGVRMEANVHVVTGLKTAIQNIYRCVERCGIKVADIVLEPIASSRSVLTKEEKEVGVALVDIGGGTTDIAIFEENVIRWTSVFGIAGKHVTDDIRKGLGIIVSQAEKIKREQGHTYEAEIIEDDIFMIPGIGGRKPMEINRSLLCKIIQPRMEEIFSFALAEIRRSGYASNLGAGIVITGGTTLLQGTEELAREVLGMPIKIGVPSEITNSGLAPEVESPVYSTCVGLALSGFENRSDSNSDSKNDSKNEPIQEIEENVDTNPADDGLELAKKKTSAFKWMKKFIKEL